MVLILLVLLFGKGHNNERDLNLYDVKRTRVVMQVGHNDALSLFKSLFLENNSGA